jgi:hypothetical protein
VAIKNLPVRSAVAKKNLTAVYLALPNHLRLERRLKPIDHQSQKRLKKSLKTAEKAVFRLFFIEITRFSALDYLSLPSLLCPVGRHHTAERLLSAEFILQGGCV